MEARPRNYNLISLKHTKNLEKYIVKDGYILVSCSGTIGNIALVTKDIDGWAVSQHAIRVVVHDINNLGPVYCYLQSPLGQFLVKRSMSGSVMQSIYAADVSYLLIKCRQL
jgi:type I restriction enzyme S subunit